MIEVLDNLLRVCTMPNKHECGFYMSPETAEKHGITGSSYRGHFIDYSIDPEPGRIVMGPRIRYEQA